MRNYTEAQIEKRVRDYVDRFTVRQLIEYIVDDLVTFYCDHADPEDLEIFMGDSTDE